MAESRRASVMDMERDRVLPKNEKKLRDGFNSVYPKQSTGTYDVQHHATPVQQTREWVRMAIVADLLYGSRTTIVVAPRNKFIRACAHLRVHFV